MFSTNNFTILTILVLLVVVTSELFVSSEIIVLKLSTNGSDPSIPTISFTPQKNETGNETRIITQAAIPIIWNPLRVTSSTFQLLKDKIGVEFSITYACGITMKLQSFVNTSLLPMAPPPLPVPVPVFPLPIASHSETRDSKIPVPLPVPGGPGAELINYLNPIVFIGSTCIPGFCANYNVNQNTLSTSGD